jgi:hypothetical protein
MSENNKIDFIPKPGKFDIDKNFEISSAVNLIKSIDIPLVVGLITFAYLRIIGSNSDNKIYIPANASVKTLVYTEGKNFFKDIFNRYKIVCGVNAILTESASILESEFMSRAEKVSEEFQKTFANELLEHDWSETGFNNTDCIAFITEVMIFEGLAEQGNSYFDDAYTDFYYEIHNLTPLLNIQPEEKQLCTPILYINYLVNIFNIFKPRGCGEVVRKELVNMCLDKVTAVEADSVLWAIHTLAVFVFGYDQQLISKADELAAIHNRLNNKEEDGFDVIFLPEVNDETIPDVGPITIGNTVTRRDIFSFYGLAFLYNLLNDTGRAFVRFSGYAEEALTPDTYNVYQRNGLLDFFVDNNFIEAIIQTKSCTYMLIDKNRDEKKLGKILFYYIHNFDGFLGCHFPDNEKLASCIKDYSCENIQIKHDEGACIISNKEIRLNNYCLLPKKYIYDFDRITANAEFQVVRHIAHDLSPKLSTVDSVLKHLTRFIASHDLLQEPLQEQYYEGQTPEPVGEAIDKARNDISQMHKLIKDTRKVITEEIPMEEFRSLILRYFLEATKKKYVNRNFTLHIDCDQDIHYEMHEASFAEMIDNFVRNAEIHGFVDGSNQTECKIAIVVTKRKNDSNLIVEIKNNGCHLPDELTVEKFISIGTKGNNSPGDGLGGAWINKVIRAHRGSLEIIRDDKEYPVYFKITLPNPEGNK